jgi:hypothetical protein
MEPILPIPSRPPAITPVPPTQSERVSRDQRPRERDGSPGKREERPRRPLPGGTRTGAEPGEEREGRHVDVRA